MTFKTGFEVNGMRYGWCGGLYRLPSEVNGRYYGFREVAPVKVGNKTGYRVGRKLMSVSQLQGITKEFDKEVRIAKVPGGITA